MNPAWNLGVWEAWGQYLAIINDDVLFDSEVFDYMAKLPRRPGAETVGPDGAFMNQETGRICHRLATKEAIHR